MILHLPFLFGLPLRTLKFFAALLCLVAMLGQPAFASSIQRPIPPAAKWVEAEFIGSERVKVDDDVYVLAAGTQIRDQNNLIVPFSQVRGTYDVRVLLDINGQLHRIWLMTPEEVADAKAKAKAKKAWWHIF